MAVPQINDDGKNILFVEISSQFQQTSGYLKWKYEIKCVVCSYPDCEFYSKEEGSCLTNHDEELRILEGLNHENRNESHQFFIDYTYHEPKTSYPNIYSDIKFLFHKYCKVDDDDERNSNEIYLDFYKLNFETCCEYYDLIKKLNYYRENLLKININPKLIKNNEVLINNGIIESKIFLKCNCYHSYCPDVYENCEYKYDDCHLVQG